MGAGHVRVEICGVPVEFVKNFDVRYALTRTALQSWSLEHGVVLLISVLNSSANTCQARIH